MGQISDFLKRQPLLVTAVVAVFAFLVGWMVMGWLIAPVQYVDGNPTQLRSDYQQEYVRMVAASYALDQNLPAAQQRLAALGPSAASLISTTLASSTGNDQIRLAQLQAVVQASGGFVETPEAQPGLLQRFGLPLACGLVTVLILLGGGLFLYWRSSATTPGGLRTGGGMPVRPVARPPMPDLEGGGPFAAVPGETAAGPIAQFMTTYVMGDDLYDDSFSVDGPDGNFLGECGMGISETIGVGDPKKVMAFEVWLFDKNDIRTVTKVLMSEHAFRDEALKSRLAAKGEPVLVKTGDVVSMETATLTVTARVVDMAYGGGALPPNSFFERLTIELAAFQKAVS